MHSIRSFTIAAVVAMVGATVFVPIGSAQQGKEQKNAASIAGQWTLSVKSPHGEVAMGLDLTQEGKKVKGALATPHGDLAVEGDFTSNTLTLATPVAGDERITMTAKLKDDGTLDGYLSSHRGDMTWTAKRTTAK